MKKTIFFIFAVLLTTVVFGQQRTPGFRTPIWMGEQPSYFNAKQNKNVKVYAGRQDADFVTFNISDADESNDVNIMFFDRNKLLTALNVCSEALTEVSSLSRKAKRAIVEGMDTVFPRAAIMWHDADTLVASFNNVLRPEINIKGGVATLSITGTAVCRIKYNDKMRDESFSGDPNVTTEYSLVFSSAHEVDELIQCIVNNTEHPVFGNISIQEAFPRVFDRNHNPHTFNGFMRNLNPSWIPQRRNIPFFRPQR